VPDNAPDRIALDSAAAPSLRFVLNLLMQDIALEPIASETLPWQQPIFVLRSAPMERLRAFVDELVRHCPAPTLHVMSHARDAEAIHRLAPFDVTFHAYPTPGRYRLAEVPAAMLERLRAVDFAAVFFLDTDPHRDLFEEVERLLSAIAAPRMIGFLHNGTFGRAPDPRFRTLAEPALFRLVEWYQRRIEAGMRLP
jgi:hypothetical protein